MSQRANLLDRNRDATRNLGRSSRIFRSEILKHVGLNRTRRLRIESGRNRVFSARGHSWAISEQKTERIYWVAATKIYLNRYKTTTADGARGGRPNVFFRFGGQRIWAGYRPRMVIWKKLFDHSTRRLIQLFHIQGLRSGRATGYMGKDANRLDLGFLQTRCIRASRSVPSPAV
jgi:hypothetical protein